MNRLDEVLGPENWWDDFVPLEHSVICRLTIRLPDGTILTKCDAGGYAGLADPGDDDKSGFADAFKRTAVKFGVGRYLYRDGVPRFSSAGTPSLDESEASDAVDASAAPNAVPSSVPCGAVRGRRRGRECSSHRPRPVRLDQSQDEKFEYGLLKHLNAGPRARTSRRGWSTGTRSRSRRLTPRPAAGSGRSRRCGTAPKPR